jgi:hypothetical protein
MFNKILLLDQINYFYGLLDMTIPKIERILFLHFDFKYFFIQIIYLTYFLDN